MGTYPRHVLYFISFLGLHLKRFIFLQFHVFFPFLSRILMTFGYFGVFFWISYVIPLSDAFAWFLDNLDVFFRLRYKYPSDTYFCSYSAAFEFFIVHSLKLESWKNFSPNETISKLGITSKKTGITSKSLDVIPEK